MRKEPQTALIIQELLLVPNGDNAQQLFRMVYEIRRLRDLAANDPPRPAGNIFEEALKDVRRHHVGFVPVVTNSDYFDLRPGQYQLPT